MTIHINDLHNLLWDLILFFWLKPNKLLFKINPALQSAIESIIV